MKSDDQKKTLKELREELLRNKEFFLLNFINDVPEEEDFQVIYQEAGPWEGCEMEYQAGALENPS